MNWRALKRIRAGMCYYDLRPERLFVCFSFLGTDGIAMGRILIACNTAKFLFSQVTEYLNRILLVFTGDGDD